MPKRLESVPRDLHASQWLEALNDKNLTKEQIVAGFERARAESNYAPQIAGFIQFCKDNASDEQRALYGRMDAANAERKALPHGTWEDRRAKALGEITKMRAALVKTRWA